MSAYWKDDKAWDLGAGRDRGRYDVGRAEDWQRLLGEMAAKKAEESRTAAWRDRTPDEYRERTAAIDRIGGEIGRSRRLGWALDLVLAAAIVGALLSATLVWALLG